MTGSQNANELPLVIIPAAGFGRRAKMSRHQSKELLLGPNGKPLIHRAIECASQRTWPILVLVRREKEELLKELELARHWCRSPLVVQVVEPGADWPDTVLLSQASWKQHNLVLLPDTDWGPTSALDQINALLYQQDFVFGTFPAVDLQKWGVIRIQNKDSVAISEKPTDGAGVAWGILGFRGPVGAELLRAQSLSSQDHQWRILPRSAGQVGLDFFSDQTRGEGPGD